LSVPSIRFPSQSKRRRARSVNKRSGRACLAEGKGTSKAGVTSRAHIDSASVQACEAEALAPAEQLSVSV
jgi:hypothetical protein